MTDRYRPRLLALVLLLMAVGAGSAQAAPVNVTLRVEGRTSTTYEGNVTTDAHLVRAANDGQSHKCDGTNGGAHPSPGPTATGALDDGARLRGFTWSGDWYPDFEDFVVTRVGPDSQTSSQFWGFLVNSVESQVGGCQARVREGDEVLWAFDGFGKTPLRLAAPGVATVGRPVSVRVTDGRDGSPESGAGVGGATTGADGRATVVFRRAGVYVLKATKSGAIRSNGVRVCADPVGAEPCTSADRSAPRLKLVLPDQVVSRSSRSRTVFLSWFGEDGETGSGVAGYDVELRDVNRGAGGRAFKGGRWWTLAERTRATGARFRGRVGRTYELRVAAQDRAANRDVESALLTFPVDDRDRSKLKLSKGWKRLKRKRAFGRRVIRSKRRGARAKLVFRGSRVAIVGRKLPRGGRLLVSVDGRRKVLRLRGRPRFRRVLYTTAKRKPGRHVLRLRALGRGPVELDAIAPLP